MPSPSGLPASPEEISNSRAIDRPSVSGRLPGVELRSLLEITRRDRAECYC
jgi:hypothetical protein